MDIAKQHWEILRRIPEELINRVREFMVIGCNGGGVILLTKDGDGYWLWEMEFGDDSKQALEPTRLDVPNLASMAQGDEHILLLDKDGHIHAMGENYYGQLGPGTVDEENYFSPQLISSPHKFTSVRCGFSHSLALTEDGKVWAWGDNSRGQVGVPTYTTDLHPSLHQISELNSHRVVAIECGGWHSLALTDQGDVYAWGSNEYEQLGIENGYDKWSLRHLDSPTQIPTSSPVQSIAAGKCHTLLLTQTGEVYACRGNESGQLGLSTTTEFNARLVKIDSLPRISQIASHFNTDLSIAMSAERECFIWGNLDNQTSISTPLQLPPIYSTLDSVHSFRSSQRNTPHSIRVKELELPLKIDSTKQTESLSGPNRLGDRASRMFDNPNSNPDVKFELGDQSILAHRSVLQISSGHFDRFFSESSSSANLSLPIPISHLSHKPFRHTTNQSKPDSQITPVSPHPQVSLTTISIPDHCYPTFHAYLHFLYTGTLQVPTEHLADLFKLAHSNLESDLSELCLVRMRSTLSPENCCLFYQLTERHSLPEFQLELVHFIADNIFQVFLTDAYQSLDAVLCKKLAISVGNLMR